MALKIEEKNKFRISLENEKEKILKGKNIGFSAIAEENENLKGLVLDEGEEAESSSRTHVNISISESFSLRLKKIKAALKRIDRGTFGECIDCGEEITPTRLEAVPWEPQCLDCKDSEEKVTGFKSGLSEEVAKDAESES